MGISKLLGVAASITLCSAAVDPNAITLGGGGGGGAIGGFIRPDEPLVGGDRDEGGCIGSAGYQYCRKLDNCQRSWELLGAYEEGTTWEDVCEPDCPEYMCLMYCEHGFQKGEDGCDICRCNPPPCPEVMCKMSCEFGFKTDEDGCEICECNEEPDCGDVMCAMYCEHGFKKNEDGCEICSCNEKPVCSDVMCEMYCDNGFKLGEDGCEICECNEEPDCGDVMCAMYCENGFQLNEKGCEICKCIEDDIIGGEQDEHGCYPGAGYQHCAALDECHRPWELLEEGQEWDDVCGLVGDDEDEYGCKASTGHEWCENWGQCVRRWEMDDFERQCNECGMVMCMMYCEHGFKQNANGCDVCSCADDPSVCGSKQKDCPNKCPAGYMDDDSGCQTCDCICPQVYCPEECPTGYKLDRSGCGTCECEDEPEPELPMCSELNLMQKYCNTVPECEKKCQCAEGEMMNVAFEGTRSAHASCDAKPEFCEDSPEQLCKMKCVEFPECGEDECVMRQGRCCDFTCESTVPECPDGEEYDDLISDCVPVSCEADPCEDDEICLDTENVCIRAPCPQYECVEAETGRMTYDEYKKACKAGKNDEEACTAVGCKYKKGKCKAQKANKFKCNKIMDEDFCKNRGPEKCKWKSKKNKPGTCNGKAQWE